MMKPLAVLPLLLTTCLGAAEHSQLWGANGEGWSADGRLPDFSFAGYRCGEKPIPEPARAADVRDFGAIGDGTADDTQAFNDAIAKTSAGAILVPKGRYRITGFVTIAKSGIVLRGAGPEHSILVFDRPLTDVKPDWGGTTSGQRTSNYSWSGGFLVIQGDVHRGTAIAITAEAARGGRELTVASVAGLAVGAWVEIRLDDDEGRTLTAELYSGDPGPYAKLKPFSTSQPAQIAAIDAVTGTVRLDRPLRWPTRTVWKPQLVPIEHSVTDSGIEGLGFSFPATPWNGEFSELGYNAIKLANCAHCWVRNVRLHNAEGGIFASGMHCTIADVVLAADKVSATKERYHAAAGCVGHHGLSLYGSDNLVTRFDFQVNYVHDLSVEGVRAAGNVFTQGRGLDLCFDHHRRAPHANLFTDIDCGAGNRIWRCGGGADLGRNGGAHGTFWNLRSAKPLAPPPAGWGAPSMNMVGLASALPTSTPPEGWWWEAIEPAKLVPQDLHAAQLKRRLAGGVP